MEIAAFCVSLLQSNLADTGAFPFDLDLLAPDCIKKSIPSCVEFEPAENS